MTYSYSGDPTTSPLDEIRFLLQDVDTTDQLFSNEEILYYIAKMTDVNGSTFKTAANLAETAAARFAREVSISSDGTSISAEQLQQKYEELAVRLRAQSVEMDASGLGPIVGGNNWDDWFFGGKKIFRMRANDNNRAGRQDGRYDPWYEYEQGGWWEGQ